MSDLFRLLALYYACDNTATERMLSAQEWVLCMRRYELVKEHFSPEDAATSVEGYKRFKMWEAENGDIVASLRQGRRL